MRFFIAISILFLFLSSIEKSNQCSCKNNYLSVSEAYEKADVVVLGEAQMVDDGIFEINVKQKWKSIYRWPMVINDPNCPMEIESGENYLIYAVKSTKDGYYITNACMGSTIEYWAKQDIEVLNYIGQCVDNSLINPYVVCERDLYPVCGCDGKTYGNPCEAMKKGIIGWKAGPCNKNLER